MRPNTPIKDPNVIDVDRKKAMSKGPCFKYQQLGHLARNCPGNKRVIIQVVNATPMLMVQIIKCQIFNKPCRCHATY